MWSLHLIKDGNLNILVYSRGVVNIMTINATFEGKFSTKWIIGDTTSPIQVSAILVVRNVVQGLGLFVYVRQVVAQDYRFTTHTASPLGFSKLSRVFRCSPFTVSDFIFLAFIFPFICHKRECRFSTIRLFLRTYSSIYILMGVYQSFMSSICG